jgi:DNA-binding transcriptional MocR family regulator
LINGLRATGWMAAPIMVDVVARLINSGRLEQQAERKRKEAQLRSNLAKACLGPWLPTIATGGFHVWLPIPPGRTVNGLVTQAASAGIILAPSDLMSRNTAGPRGIRLCLGGPPTLRDLEHALRLLRGILDRPEAMSVI